MLGGIVIMLPHVKFSLLTVIPLGNWAQETNHPRVHLSAFAAIRASRMFADDIAVIGANRETRRKGKVRQFVIFANRFDQFLQRLRIIHAFA